MKFSIITPTYRRPEKLKRAILSVFEQSHSDWELLIVNDSPEYRGYENLLAEYANEPRVRYIVNDKNSGVNYSRNRALDTVALDSDYVILLDDDDYLTSQALPELIKLLQENPETKWLVTNRKEVTGNIVTKALQDNKVYNYARDYLLGRKIKGDATHCIKSSLLKNIRFSTDIKQGEEWLFFFSLGQKTNFLYKNINTTLTDGYAESGLNHRSRPKKEQLKTWWIFLKEGRERKLLLSPYFLIYLAIRLLRIVIRST